MRYLIFIGLFVLCASSVEASFTPKEGIVEDDRAWYQWREFKIGDNISYWAIQLVQLKTAYAQADELPLSGKIQNFLHSTAEKYGLKKKVFIGVAKCESGFNPKAQGDWRSEEDKYMANGIFQFWENTFDLFKKESGMTKLKYENWEDQVELAGWAFANEKANHWWNCWTSVKRKI